MDRQFRQIIDLGKPYLWRIGLCLVLIILATGIQLILPLAIKAIFDEVMDGGNGEFITLTAAIMFAIFIFRGALSFFGRFLLQVIGDTITCDLRIHFFEHIQAQSLSFHQRQRVGDLISRFSSDIASIRNIIANLSVSVVLGVLQLVGSTIIMMLMSWRLGLIVLLVGPLTTIVTKLFGPIFQKLSMYIQDALAYSAVVTQETLSGIEVVVSYDRGAHELSRFKRAMSGLLRTAIRARKVDSIYNSIVTFISSSSTIAIFWYGGFLVLDNRLSAGGLVAFLLYSQTVTQSISSLAQQYSGVKESLGSSRRIFDILNVDTVMRDRPDAVLFGGASANISFKNVSFKYDNDSAPLTDVSFCVKAGETVAVVGPSGAGKSTLLKLVVRLYDVNDGVISINDVDIRRYS